MRPSLLFIGIVLVLAPGLLVAETQADRDLVLERARETIKEARYAALITVDAEGQPRARTVDPFLPDENFHIWIATRPVTRKVLQIRAHPQVTVYYFDPVHRNYVTLMGTARIVEDDAIKRKMRREVDSDRLYPDFPNDYVLIEVTPGWLEAIVPGYRGDSKTWQPVSVRFD